MIKDLTTSRIDRQNILNNEMAIEEIQKNVVEKMVFWNDKYYLTKEMLASFFDVEVRTIERYISTYGEELKENGYELLKGKRLPSFITAYDETFATDINAAHKIRSISVFDFRAFLNMAMLLSGSDKARALRQLMLDVVIDLINRRTGGGTKYINQRDKDYIGSALQEENYRRQFTDALKLYVAEIRYKYAHFTDMIYVSIFKEKAHEYKKILDLKASEKVRDTFYSEILDIIAAYESGLADALQKEYEKLGHILSIKEAEDLFHQFESMALFYGWQQKAGNHSQCSIPASKRIYGCCQTVFYCYGKHQLSCGGRKNQ